MSVNNNKIPLTPLLHAIPSKTPLDLVTERFFFLFPISKEQMEWLNTIIYQDQHFWINYWSLTHTFLGIIYGLLYFLYPNIFTIKLYIIIHTLFELWELWAGGYFSGKHQIIYQEIIDIILDTVFGLAGVYLANYMLNRLNQL